MKERESISLLQSAASRMSRFADSPGPPDGTVTIQQSCDSIRDRASAAAVPVTVEYSITALGRTLTATVDGLTRWAEENIQAVLQAQRRCDEDGSNRPQLAI